jgi:hypothetical protein
LILDFLVSFKILLLFCEIVDWYYAYDGSF